MHTAAGAFIASFGTWKNLPERKDTEAFKKGTKFERNLSLLVRNNLKQSFDPMREIDYEG